MGSISLSRRHLPTAANALALPQQASRQRLTARIGNVMVPDALEDLHPKVKAWLTQHKQEQLERQ